MTHTHTRPHRLIMAFVLGAAAVSSSAHAQVVVVDGAFNPGSYVVQSFTGGFGATAQFTQSQAGLPGTSGLVTITLVPGDPSPLSGSWGWLAVFHTSATADPASFGAIGSIDFESDAGFISGSTYPRQQVYGVALRQGGEVFYAALPPTPAQNWAARDRLGLTASNFGRVVNLPDYFSDPAQHPDFSAAAPPIEVGFLRGNQNIAPLFLGFTTGVGIDNLRIVIHPSSTCDTVDFNGDGLFPDTQDIDDFLTLFAGGSCSTGACGDIDFNNDGLFPDTLDIDSLLNVFSGGACL